jgi:hypothetical protein
LIYFHRLIRRNNQSLGIVIAIGANVAFGHERRFECIVGVTASPLIAAAILQCDIDRVGPKGDMTRMSLLTIYVPTASRPLGRAR